jgi:hypothetical protein
MDHSVHIESLKIIAQGDPSGKPMAVNSRP